MVADHEFDEWPNFGEPRAPGEDVRVAVSVDEPGLGQFRLVSTVDVDLDPGTALRQFVRGEFDLVSRVVAT